MSLTAFFVFFPLGLISFFLYDRVLKTLFFQFPEIWEKEKSPIGMFWSPPGSKTFSGSFARNWFMLKLIFLTPDWAKENRHTLYFLWAYRICIFSAWVVCLFGSRLFRR